MVLESMQDRGEVIGKGGEDPRQEPCDGWGRGVDRLITCDLEKTKRNIG